MATTSGLSAPARVQSIDIIRGAVMVLMAIDHVRVYSGLPAGGPDPGIFFTRWITHFCAPVFVFFAGTAAFFYDRKLANTKTLQRYLVSRGLLLVLLELTLIRFSWTFNFNYAGFTLAGVIWMIGWCMVLLALLVRMSPVVVGIIGLCIITFQSVFSFFPLLLPASWVPLVGGLWEFIYPSGSEPLGGITILYVLVPWVGVMAAGYGFGTILLLEPGRRDRICLIVGLAAIALFLVVGSIMVIMKPQEPDAPAFIFQLLNQRKYPASQLYLLMTLGPAVALLPWAGRARGWVADVISVFGRVPFFYYLLHIPLIHISALLVNLVISGATQQQWYNSAPYVFVPEESRWSLALLYALFAIDVIVLYFACQWYVRYKFSHPNIKWLKYI